MQVTFSTVSLPALLAEARAAMETQVTVIDLADAGRVRISIGENLGADACGTCEPMEVRHHTYAAIAGTAEVEVTPHYDEDEDEETLWRAFATVRLSGVVLSDADSCELTLDDIDLSGWGGALLPIG